MNITIQEKNEVLQGKFIPQITPGLKPVVGLTELVTIS
jgi:hypothetical protein